MSWQLNISKGDNKDTWERFVEYIEDEIEELKKHSIGDYINNALEIRRCQSYLIDEGKWDTQYYTLVLTLGGPYVEIDTRGYFTFIWGDSYYEAKITDEDTLNKLYEIEEYLEYNYR